MIAVYFDAKGKVTKLVSYPAPRLLAARHGFFAADELDRFEGLVRAIGEDGVAFLRRDVAPVSEADAIARLVPPKQRFIAVDPADMPAGDHAAGAGWFVKDGKLVAGEAAPGPA